jgi:hypothetical protein
MKHLLLRVVSVWVGFALGLGATQIGFVLSSPKPSDVYVDNEVQVDENLLLFEGTVLQIGPPVPGSGGVAFYRLAKFRVDRIVIGNYSRAEIVVDQLSLTGKELDDLRLGDRVCVTVEKSKEIFSRMNVSGLREETEQIDTFNLVTNITPNMTTCR